MVSTFQPQEPTPRVVLASAVALMVHYFGIREVDAWTETFLLAGRYSPDWVRLAVVEALYQGRYKVVSVQQILDIWRRRGKVVSHFNREFEAIVTVPLPDAIQAELRTIAKAHQAAHVQSRQSQELLAPLPELKTPALQTPALQTLEATEPDGNTHRSESPSLPLLVSPEISERPTIVPSTTIGEIPVITLDYPRDASPIPLLDETATPPFSQHNPDPAPADLLSKPIALIPPTLLHLEPKPISSQGNPLKPLLSFHRHPIHIDRFCPTPDPSGFDRKLLALANQG